MFALETTILINRKIGLKDVVCKTSFQFSCFNKKKINNFLPGNIFEWTDGSESNYTNWDVGQPDDSGGIESCTVVHNVRSSTMLWNDIDCEIPRGYICSTKKGTICIKINK